ncbi:putative MFS transporter [Aspergillus novofumigatus IBT 16806]|uniref:Putative MFS transporter n=1 Tax=Aspergillus novofumigatus (strain IBT 16806) TaxID=1392255 RepID=A0A2I1CLG8_ASPN1|nr:putative MFS transporter [Aspergillus novofumigatus IBT 16806]PKX98465.1 putative MFS transporter [Aspergillus novofumigatus IBT 16806]
MASPSPSPTAALDPEKNTQDTLHLPLWRKCIILFIVSWMTFVVTFSSTSLLPATPEIATEFNTTPELLNVTNAGVLLAMGFSSLIWGPVTALLGRRVAYNIAIGALCGVFTAFRVLGGLTGTSFMVQGQTILADIFEAVRGTAVGFFMAGTVTGRRLVGPCIGGLVVTFAHWRVIFWVQVAMAGLGLVLSLLFVPEVEKREAEGEGVPRPSSLREVLAMFNPVRIFRQWLYPNVFLCDLTCGLLAIFQYGLLTSAREIFNPRFNLTSALVSGLFYLAPGAGFLLGSILGGRLSDRTVKRLNSGLATLCVVLPIAVLVYGWTLEKRAGGMAVPVIAAFWAGVGLMGSFNGLNTYAAEAIPERRSEVISGKYIVQYLCSAGSSAAVVPLVKVIGVGWTFTICVVLSLLGGGFVFCITRWGKAMQLWAEEKFHLDGKTGL